jgi:hypothetical protein
MEDFGQLIALIIGVIFLVINSIGKKKKPVATPPQSASSKPKVPRSKTGIPELDELLEEFSDIEEDIEENSQPIYETLETIEPDSPFAAYNSINIPESTSKYEKIADVKPSVTTNFFEEVETASLKEDSGFNFNLPDAIIFSEIIKRPSY